MHHETCARCIVLWQVGDSFLQNGGTAAELLRHNLWYRDKVTKKEVVLNGTVMEGLKHEFILMPLIFTIQSEETASAELARTNAWDIVSGQVYAKFEVCKVLAQLENEKHSPDLLAGLPDPRGADRRSCQRYIHTEVQNHNPRPKS